MMTFARVPELKLVEVRLRTVADEPAYLNYLAVYRLEGRPTLMRSSYGRSFFCASDSVDL